MILVISGLVSLIKSTPFRHKKAAVQIDLKTWNALLGYLEDLEDRSLIREKLHRLLTGPEKSGAVTWDAVY